MKKTILMLAIASMSLAYAQQPAHHKKHTPQERAEKLTEKMTQELGLSAETKAKVSEINYEKARKVEQLRNEAIADKERKKEARQKLKQEHETQLKAVLTPEQFEKWLKLREEMKQKHKEKRMHHKKNEQ